MSEGNRKITFWNSGGSIVAVFVAALSCVLIVGARMKSASTSEGTEYSGATSKNFTSMFGRSMPKSKHEFYERAMELAQESRDAQDGKEGPWRKINSDSVAEAKRLQKDLKTLEDQLNAAEKKRSELMARKESIFKEYPVFRDSENGKYDLSTVSRYDGRYTFNTWGEFPSPNDPPHGVEFCFDEIVKTDGTGRIIGSNNHIRAVVLTSPACKAWDEVENLNSQIHSHEYRSLVDRVGYSRQYIEGLKSPVYSMTASDVIDRLGNPDSIIKHDFNRHAWIYRFPDGTVRIILKGPRNLHENGAIVWLRPQDVDKF